MNIWLLVLLLFAHVWAFAQRPTNSQLVINPSFYNPAYTAYHQRSELLLGYQQQWLGINEAPSLASFQYDATFTRHIGLGVQATRQMVGPIQNHRANLLFAYKVPLSKESHLAFGLSGGISQLSLNSRATYNPLDPAVVQLNNTSFSPQFAFGSSLQISHFNVGIALPELLPTTTGLASDITNSKPYDQLVVNVDYRFTFPAGNIALRPFLLYHRHQSVSTVTEGGSLIYFQDIVFAGGGYRLDYGPTALAGLLLNDFRFSYRYEHPTAIVNQIGQGGHEIQLSYRFVKLTSKKKPKEKKPDSTFTPTQPKADTLATEAPPVEEEVLEEQPQESNHAVFYRGDHPEELGVGFYVIVGSFQNTDFARQQARKISQQGTFTGLGYNSDRAYYYLFIYRSDDLEKTRTARNKYRQEALFQDAWLLEIKDRE